MSIHAGIQSNLPIFLEGICCYCNDRDAGFLFVIHCPYLCSRLISLCRASEIDRIILLPLK